MIKTKTTSRKTAFKVNRMSECIMESRDEFIMRKYDGNESEITSKGSVYAKKPPILILQKRRPVNLWMLYRCPSSGEGLNTMGASHSKNFVDLLTNLLICPTKKREDILPIYLSTKCKYLPILLT